MNKIYPNSINSNVVNGSIVQQMRQNSSASNINRNFIPNPNTNYAFNKVNKISESKELKLRKQEEYRKELDDQMKFELQRKERERQIKYGGGINGLGSLNIPNKTNNNMNNMMNNTNYPINNNSNINGINNNLNNNINNYNIANNKNMNMPEMNNTIITRPNINQEEKEKLRKKQMEYNEILRQQVEERNKMKEIAKQKEKEEEIKFEEKLKRQLIENQKRAELIKNNEFKNNKYAHNLEYPETFMANPMSTMPIPQINIQGQTIQNNNNSNPNYTVLGGFYGNNTNNLLNNQNNQISMNNTNMDKYNNIEGKTELVQNNPNLNNQNINPNNFNNYQNNYMNLTPSSNKNINSNNAYNLQNTPYNYGQRPTPSQTATAFGSTSKTNSFNSNNNNNINNNINTNYPYIVNNNNNYNSNIRPISQQSQRRQRNDTWRMEELYMNFVQEQLRIINEYEMDINKYQDLKKDNFDTIKDLMIIKNKALDRIQEAQNKFKDTVGVYPMDNNFNNRVTNLMDMMLEKKINDIQRENKLEILANNFNKQKRNGRINYNNINSINENGIYSNDINNEDNNNEFIPITESQLNRNMMGCGYKSKYEELKKSMINGNEASQELRTSMSLAGFSKFVTQNKLVEKNENIYVQDNNDDNNNDINNYQNIFCNINNGQSNLYTTWNSEKFEEDQKNNVNNINNNSPLNTNEIINDNNNNNINTNQETLETKVNNKNISPITHLI